jgi:hypothetical protein
MRFAALFRRSRLLMHSTCRIILEGWIFYFGVPELIWTGIEIDPDGYLN